MKKETIETKVAKKVNPLINILAEYKDGPSGMEEYGRRIWNRESIQRICEEVFNETYKLMK
jgi:hypothetical protein